MIRGKKLIVTACFIATTTIPHPAQSQQSKPAEPHVAAANRAVKSHLLFRDRQDFEDAMRGFIATTPDPANPDRWAFLQQEAPPTVNSNTVRVVVNVATALAAALPKGSIRFVSAAGRLRSRISDRRAGTLTVEGLEPGEPCVTLLLIYDCDCLLGPSSAAPDRWIWVHGAGVCQVVQGSGRVRRYCPGDGRP
jgi:hypothetical protein